MVVAPFGGRESGAASAGAAAPPAAQRSAALPVRHAADRGERPRQFDPVAESTRHRFLMMLYLQAGSRDGIWSRR